MTLRDIKITSLSMVDHKGRQRFLLQCTASQSMHLLLNIFSRGKKLVSDYPFVLCGGTAETDLMLPAVREDARTLWQITDKNGQILAETEVLHKKPRELTLYAMTSSHTDIGLHNSQYIQKYNSSVFTDKARALCDATSDRAEEDQYRYVIEGTWFFENYIKDRCEEKARELIENYIKPGKIGVCCCLAGNHTQMYGLEELCMSTYEKRKLEEVYGIRSKTMSMIDNNGISMSIIAPYADAGIEHIIFAPNQWNPLPSTIWNTDKNIEDYTWNPQAQGGGSRIDIRYTSDLPMLFFWKDAASDKKLLVWGSTQYGSGGAFWGVSQRKDPHEKNRDRVGEMESAIAKNLPIFERQYPYDVWMFAAYDDDMEPNLYLADTIQMWNAKWAWPKFRMMGNPDEPFALIKEKYAGQIPVLTGDITGGWYQHPLTTPELVTKKFQADRLLPTAEKLTTLACLIDPGHSYPDTDFNRAWNYLLLHDEHSYGTSGYQGRRVYETWMQHNDWLNKTMAISEREIGRAMETIASEIRTDTDDTVVFNPASQEREEYIIREDGAWAGARIPSMGYTVISREKFKKFSYEISSPSSPPTVENQYYRVSFAKSGGICSIYDKQLKCELLNPKAPYWANEPVYTRDNHQSFQIPENGEFTVKTSPERIQVTVVNKNSIAGADIVRTVTLDSIAKRIDLDNTLYHTREFYNNCRYYRYLYFAFPFHVPNARRYCHLNGSIAEYGKTVTGHGTDVYLASNEWCCAQNGQKGIALIQPDTTLIEFDHIHPDKTDFGNTGEGSEIYSYAANDWLQMHAYGSDYFNFHFRYAITSYTGGYEQAGIPAMAEQLCTPVQMVKTGKQNGKFIRKSASLIDFKTSMRLVSLKRAKDGQGILTRFYGKWDSPEVKSGLLPHGTMEVSGTNEYALSFPTQGEHGFYTCRLDRETLRLRQCKPKVPKPDSVGSAYTELITAPMAARGEDSGHLYLLWGHAAAEDIACYRLYRGETEDFLCDADSFVADVEPGKFRVVSYEDRGLEEYHTYYYRVCAVHADGSCGALSQVFRGITKETL